ncbi:uncharacterized protein LOC121994714 isoform X2 [Zingiber officinale]|uniref:uncharacterized protein LOC121994714 isoform X2 n=1 Tax=Zingiber officinale TaxID=94328 RepID=UPI001C4CC3C6|nr:uncharacterized protein LOC121994714 isoform X2 [Zingiber officinale]XP_042404706.1 uncharacterized protein LOC121994714 isoform X2 [Zingiber officinale]XP_042404755.1 uncharacterized protein LOC121994714 isoform X2 [Zingiber officinale]
MLGPFLYQMTILCSSSNTRVAVALCLLLIFWGCCNDHLISTFLTLFLLVLSPSAALVIRRIGKAERASRSLADKKATTELEAATSSEVATSLESEGSECEITACMGTTGLIEKDEENLSPSASPEDACHPEDSMISDDENLIEISLPDGHFVAHEEPLPQSNGCLPSFLQDSVRQHGLTELLSEINEEDNLIEIDIIRGSIKCSRVGIKA